MECKVGPGPGPGRPKSKNLQVKVQEYEFTDDPQDIPRTPKNDAPNRSEGALPHNVCYISVILYLLCLCFSSLLLKLNQIYFTINCGASLTQIELLWQRTFVCYSVCLFSSFFRFWASVEPYCADITNEEIRLLEELLKPPEDEAEYFKV